MTITQRKEVLYKLTRMFNSDLRILQEEFKVSFNFDKKYRIVETTTQGTKGKYYYKRETQSGALLEEFLTIKFRGNDAPRGAESGQYVIFKNIKYNRDVLELLQLNVALILKDAK